MVYGSNSPSTSELKDYTDTHKEIMELAMTNALGTYHDPPGLSEVIPPFPAQDNITISLKKHNPRKGGSLFRYKAKIRTQ